MKCSPRPTAPTAFFRLFTTLFILIFGIRQETHDELDSWSAGKIASVDQEKGGVMESIHIGLLHTFSQTKV